MKLRQVYASTNKIIVRNFMIFIRLEAKNSTFLNLVRCKRMERLLWAVISQYPIIFTRLPVLNFLNQ